MRSILLLSVLTITSAQIFDRNIRPAGRFDRQTDYNHQRDTADTLSHAPDGWNSQFIQDPGDAMLVVYQMPTDGIIKGVNVPVNEWGTGDQQLTVSLHRVSYPFRVDDSQYPVDVVDGAGWIGGYDMDDSTGYMHIMGTYYSAGGTAGICDTSDTVVEGAHDPLGFEPGSFVPGVPQMGLVWPTDFIVPTLDSTNNPSIASGGGDNWINTADFGSEPTFLSGEYVGILVYSSGAGGGDAPETGFQYQAGGPLGLNNPWTSLKFYGSTEPDGLCGGTSGNDGWHIRHWVFDFELAVLFTGDRAPIISNPTILTTTYSTEPRDISVIVTDDNPSGGPAGVASVEFYYSIDGGAFIAVLLVYSGNNLYTGQIPGQIGGTSGEYYFRATDVEGNVAQTATYAYSIFLPLNTNLFILNSSRSFYWIMYLWPDAPFDFWNYGVVPPELLDHYNLVVEITTGGPAWLNNDSIRPWIENGGHYVIAGDDWLSAQIGWTDSISPGSFLYDIIGIEEAYGDICLGGVSRLLTVAGDSISGALHAFLADSLDLNYDPEYELGLNNWLDGVTPVAGVNVAFYGLSGQIDSLNNPSTDVDTFSTGIYHTLPGGGKVVFLSFDPLATNTTPVYHWIGVESFGPLQAAIGWVLGTTATDEIPLVPLQLTLYQNYPNPFNPVTTIRYELPERTELRLTIYDLLGREVAVLADDAQGPGIRVVQWDASNVASGIYLYRLQTDNQTITKKLVVLK